MQCKWVMHIMKVINQSIFYLLLPVLHCVTFIFRRIILFYADEENSDEEISNDNIMHCGLWLITM